MLVRSATKRSWDLVAVRASKAAPYVRVVHKPSPNAHFSLLLLSRYSTRLSHSCAKRYSPLPSIGSERRRRRVTMRTMRNRGGSVLIGQQNGLRTRKLRQPLIGNWPSSICWSVCLHAPHLSQVENNIEKGTGLVFLNCVLFFPCKRKRQCLGLYSIYFFYGRVVQVRGLTWLNENFAIELPEGVLHLARSKEKPLNCFLT